MGTAHLGLECDGTRRLENTSHMGYESPFPVEELSSLRGTFKRGHRRGPGNLQVGLVLEKVATWRVDWTGPG